MQLSLLCAGVFAALAGHVHANGQNMPMAWFEVQPGQPGDDGTDYSKNPVYSVGDTITFRWESRYAKTGIIMWQMYPAEPESRLPLVSDSTDSSVKWTVTKDWVQHTEPGQTIVAYLALYEAGSTSVAVSSHYFNITGDSSDSGATTTNAAATTLVTSAAAASQDTDVNTNVETIHASQVVMTAPGLGGNSGGSGSSGGAATADAAVGGATAAAGDATSIVMEAAGATATAPAAQPSSGSAALSVTGGLYVVSAAVALGLGRMMLA